ncbi:glycoside hydrolase family 27 protein [Brevundimonas sp.]|uniref:glycoside hydrolase family 27 protein n=1 Tax=Brevundimonas sp. TaxID=1871086 RepID=UPI002D45FC54|nr:glycoside hydrolase family 27 protein [Brevundimonas sp.]HYC99373.1 glycoside hydrolase family 27 protein [Brevundimonas sp.]
MRGSILSLVVAAAICSLSSTQVQAQAPDPNTIAPSQDPTRTANGLAMTPPMGWNSWNKFGCDVNERVVRHVADAMVNSGMRDAGYVYVVIDDCWQGPRDADGFITVDPVRFPSGMKALADYVHSKGLKFGLYSDAGRMTCAGRPGSQGHEYQDAITYARWGVDYLKYDWCYSGVRNAEEAYALMADALRSTGRPIVFSMCEWGNNRPWLWASKIGNLWRTTGDIADIWEGKKGNNWGVLNLADMNEPLWPYAGPGHWNDPDMLEVGNGGMTNIEYRSHFSLWAMMAAPLIAGNDIATMDETTRDILMNTEVIAVNQDAAGVQGRRVRDEGDLEVWVKALAGGARAVLLFNRGPEAANIEVTWDELGYPPSLRANVRDLWAHRDLAPARDRFGASVPSHGVVMLKIGA